MQTTKEPPTITQPRATLTHRMKRYLINFAWGIGLLFLLVMTAFFLLIAALGPK